MTALWILNHLLTIYVAACVVFAVSAYWACRK